MLLFKTSIFTIYLVSATVISEIQIQGNQKTKDIILKREIFHPVKSKLDTNIVQNDINRLKNLGLFSEVKWNVVPIEDGTSILVINVIESVYKTPPIVLPSYSEETGWSVVGLLMVTNFRGLNQSILISGSLGGKDTYGFNFSDPWIMGDHLSFSFQANKTMYQHRFLSNEIVLSSTGINIGRWNGNFLKSELGLNFENKSYFKDESLHNRFFYVNPILNIKYDKRDIFWNPSRGYLITHIINHKQSLDYEKFSTSNWIQSYSWFCTFRDNVKKSIFAFNSTIRTKYGNKNPLWIEYIGNASTVRGWLLPDSTLYFSREEIFRFGHESIHGSFEIRQEIIPKQASSIGTEIGLLGVLFIDVGIISDDRKKFRKQIPIYGFGCGLRIPFPMIGSIRLDYGWGLRKSNWNKGAIHFSIGQKF